jgi:long-chain acyl-CoA synthetase
VSTLHELGVAAGEAYGDLKFLGTYKDDAWNWTIFASYGVERGDRVAVISKNREELVTTMYGAYAAGAAHVPMYEQQKPEEWEYILNDSEAKVVFVSTAALLPSARGRHGIQRALTLPFRCPPGLQPKHHLKTI